MEIDEGSKIWVLGSMGHDVERCFNWSSVMPSFQDFDILIIDFTHMTEYDFKNNLLKLSVTFEEIEKRVDNDGILVCILSDNYFEETIMPNSKDGRQTYVQDPFITNTMYDLLPVKPIIKTQKPSKDIVPDLDSFAFDYYIKYVKKVNFKIIRLFNQDKDKSKLKNKYYVCDEIVKTKGGDIIGCSYRYNKGIIHFLPPPSKMEINKAIDFIINDVILENKIENIDDRRPKWMDKHLLKDEKKIINDLSELEKKYTREKQKLESSRKSYEEINKIVWLCGNIDKGKPLENSIENFLKKEFDMKLKRTKPGAYIDYNGKYKGKKFALEITGVKKMVKKKGGKVTQAINYYGEKEENEKIVLIANTYCNTELSKRPKKANENFTKEVVKPFISMNACMVSTLTLFNLWKQMKEGKKTKDEIIDLLYNTRGVLTV